MSATGIGSLSHPLQQHGTVDFYLRSLFTRVEAKQSLLRLRRNVESQKEAVSRGVRRL